MTDDLTYPPAEVGASLSRTRGERRAVIGTGAGTFARASAANLRWAVKTRSGFRVVRVDADGATPEEMDTITGNVPKPVLAIISGIWGRSYRRDVAPAWRS